eukprot:Skav231684  [mRNA]  locus=scaffold597:911419:924323:+ [translate_table: standard]
MKAARERLGLSLNVTTGEGQKVQHKQKIQSTTEEDVAKRYKLGGMVMESTNRGMEVVWGTRLSDGRQCVVKTRQKGVVRQTLDALKVMHQSGRIHKDLKAENVMVDLPPAESPKGRANRHRDGKGVGWAGEEVEGMVMRASMSPRLSSGKERLMDGGDAQSPASVKLIDFDTVEDWEPSSPKAKDVLGTDGYIAPEAYLGDYSPASDIYSVGVVMYKLLTGRFPSREDIFDDKPGENWVGSPAMKRIHERLKTEKINFTRPPLDRCSQAAHLCALMLNFEPMDRPTAEDALKHPWFLLKSDKLPERR